MYYNITHYLFCAYIQYTVHSVHFLYIECSQWTACIPVYFKEIYKLQNLFNLRLDSECEIPSHEINIHVSEVM